MTIFKVHDLVNYDGKGHTMDGCVFYLTDDDEIYVESRHVGFFKHPELTTKVELMEWLHSLRTEGHMITSQEVKA